MAERRFKHWAYLNDEGKKEWGEIFPSGMVPVVSMLPMTLNLGGKLERAYKVSIPELSDGQFEAVVSKIAEKFHAPKAFIRKDFLEKGIPLRESLTSGSGTNQIGLFL